MQFLQFSAFSILISVFFSCNKNNPSDKSDVLITKFSKTILREKASKKSREIANIPQNTKLIDLHSVSRNAIAIEIEGKIYEEPWIKVAQIDGDTGWVFAASVMLAKGDSIEQQNWLYNLRLQRLAGAALANHMQTDLGKDKISNSLLPFFKKIKFYQDTLNSLLSKKISINDKGELPDLFWLNNVCPFWIIQTVNAQSGYAIYLHYKQLSKEAKTTKDIKDDAIFAVYERIFPFDSIESSVPCWKIQTEENVCFSLLGTGKHRELLQMIATEMPSVVDNHESSIFVAAQLNALKEEILDDILNKKTAYWHSIPSILEEIKKILEIKPSSFFSNAEKIALETRLQMFGKADENGIRTNVRTGK
jgi:uncharacterized protein YhbP (UPF0306 family)